MNRIPDGATVVWRPHDGFQKRALECGAFEALIGGAAGPGKTDVLLYGGLRDIEHPQTRQLFLRKTFPELREVMDRTLGTFRQCGGEWRESEKRWHFPEGSTYEFGYCGTFAEAQQYLGQEYTGIRFDELGECPEERIPLFLLSRIRSTDPTLRLEFRASANPGGAGHAWIKRRYVIPCGKDGSRIYRDPASRLTRAFIPGRLSDNPSLSTAYRRQLELLPDMMRRRFIDGDWDAGEGLALEEINEAHHIVKPFTVPDWWYQWGALDWGFRHPFCAGHFAADGDGNVYLVDTVWARGLLPARLAERVQEKLPIERLRQFVAGHDVWQDNRSKSENVPTVAEEFARNGIALQHASISRISGLNNLRRYLAWRGMGDEGRDAPPRFRIFDTPGNRRVFAQLESMVVDPDDLEDVLKVDADMYGEGGDDGYDMTRYGLAARPLVASEPAREIRSAWEPAVLEHEADEGRRVREKLDKVKGKRANVDILGGW